MRILLTELRRVLSQRFTLLCILGGAALGALFPCTNLRNPDRTIEQLFGTPGIIYGLFLVMAMMVVPLGRDFTQRTFQQKIAQGGRRVPLVLATFSVSLLGAAGGALVFPVSAVLPTKIDNTHTFFIIPHRIIYNFLKQRSAFCGNLVSFP